MRLLMKASLTLQRLHFDLVWYYKVTKHLVAQAHSCGTTCPQILEMLLILQLCSKICVELNTLVVYIFLFNKFFSTAPRHLVENLPPYTNVSLKLILINPEGRKESDDTIVQTDEDGGTFILVCAGFTFFILGSLLWLLPFLRVYGKNLLFLVDITSSRSCSQSVFKSFSIWRQHPTLLEETLWTQWNHHTIWGNLNYRQKSTALIIGKHLETNVLSLSTLTDQLLWPAFFWPFVSSWSVSTNSVPAL